jgi:hypothetical protein
MAAERRGLLWAIARYSTRPETPTLESDRVAGPLVAKASTCSVRAPEYVLSNAGRLWLESDLNGKQRLQQALFPQGVTFDSH